MYWQHGKQHLMIMRLKQSRGGKSDDRMNSRVLINSLLHHYPDILEHNTVFQRIQE